MTFLTLQHRIAKPLGYLYVLFGYAGLLGGLWVPGALNLEGREALAFASFGVVFGALSVFLGIFMFRQARRIEIIREFLGWRAMKHNESS